MKKQNKKPQRQNPPMEEVIWQPLSSLPLIAQIIDEGVTDAENQLRLLEEGKEKPHVFDDALVARIKNLHNSKLEFVDIYLEQIERWKKETLTMDQHFELMRLVQQSNRLKVLVTSILALADVIGEKTINKIMAMDDAELGLRFLLGEIK
jgi:hypothetical protein